MPGRVGADAIEKRHYDANTGQFTQQDPIGIAGGANVYGYAGGDPITFSDPFGLCAESSDTVQTRYAHLSETCVQQGDTVTAGQLIGYTGETGAPGQPHLHFEVCTPTSGNGVARGTCTQQDPVAFLLKNNWSIPLFPLEEITSGFGPRVIDGMPGNHLGADLRARTRLPVYAAQSGIVTWSGTAGTYGTAIYINHPR